ncbi:LamG-like jellyroll fold domain-containing protein [Sphingobacterium lactis]|uniref:LamG-like jellyroll fold domain-containing protein n=1 Tax=Sphingobacterium lactis TaxID=797291 RepID=UPI003F81E521
MKNTNQILTFLVLMVSSFFLVSCSQDFEKLTKEYNTDPDAQDAVMTKVLVVVVDGVRGDMLNVMEPVNFRMIAKNAFYCNNSLGDFTNSAFTKETGYANIFTGVTSEKSEVLNDLSTWEGEAYPTFIGRIKSTVPKFNSLAFVSDDKLKNTLLKEIDQSEVLANDAEIVSKTKAAIQKEDDVNLIVTQLSNPYKVGKASSFETDDVKYRDAINTLDAQLGELTESIKSRPDYLKENWLVVVTSSYGGEIAYKDPNDPTRFADSKRDVFTYFYSPLFSKKVVTKPVTSPFNFATSVMSVPYISSSFVAVYHLRNADKFNFDYSESFTINFFAKQIALPGIGKELTVIRKRGNVNPFLRGWEAMVNSDATVRFRVTGMDGFIETTKIEDTNWHVITVTVNRATAKASIYIDGVLSAEKDVEALDLTNDEPLLIGKVHTILNNQGLGYFYNFEDHSGNYSYCNFQIYDFAWTSADVTKYAGLSTVNPEVSPYFDSLLGYWPTYEDNNGSRTLSDASGNGFTMASANRVAFVTDQLKSNFIQSVVPLSKYKEVPNQVDIAPFIYQWFGILPSKDWKLDGQSWQPPYLILEY